MLARLCIVIVSACFISSCSQEPAPSKLPFPELSGPYLGQTPPGEEPALFAPGIVNTGLYTRDMAMMPDGSEIYYGVNVGNHALTAIMVTRQIEGRWSPPEVASFSADPRWSDIEPCIAPDGQTMYFASTRPPAEKDAEKDAKDVKDAKEAEDNHSIWAMKREGDGWGKPTRLPDVINDGSSNFYPSVTRDGTLYFTRDLSDGGNAIFRSRLVGGEYVEPERLPEQVNATRNQFNAFVAPDESYVIVPIYGMPDSLGSTDYYITFRGEDDTWSEPVNLGEKINTSGGLEYAPYISPDGKYFFFMSARTDAAAAADEMAGNRLTAEKMRELHNRPGTGLPGIWWVEASFLSDLRPQKP